MHSTIYVYPGRDSNRSLDASNPDARTATLNSVIRGAMTDTEYVFGVEYRDNLKQAVEYFAAVIESRFPHLPPWMDAYERIEEHRARIDELTAQLAAQAPLVAIAMELREALIGKWRSFGGDYFQDYTAYVRFRTMDDAMRFHSALKKFIKLRDAKGGV